MRRLLAAAVLLALVASGSALAAVAKHGDPQRKIQGADQARAKAMLLRKTDLPPAFKATTPDPDSGHYYCKALDESDLTLTGDAESKDFSAQIVFASSVAQVYETLADAKASWRRGTSAAGVRCARRLLTEEFAKQGITVRSFRRVAFPRVTTGGRTLAFRLVLRSQGVQVFMDIIGLEHARAHSTLIVGAALTQFPKAEAVKLARVLARRMATAMRGA